MKKIFFVLLAALISCADKDEVKQIDQLFSSEFKSDEPGAAVLIMKNDSVIFERGYGLADLATKEKVTPSTLFNTGSISKTFVSNTLLSLADEGKVSVNDSLAQYFPNFKNKKIANQLKLHFLLTHTSGLHDNRREFLDSVALLTAKDQENWNPIEQNDSLEFQPGSRFQYSNPAFNGLALIIEKVAQKKWQEAVAERVFKPAGMPTSKITDGSFPENGVAHGYVKNHGTYIEKDYGEEPTFAAAGNGGVWSSVKELANYEMALRKGAVLKKDLVEHSRSVMHYSNWTDSVAPFIGYSWFIGKTEDGSKMVSHTGTQGGFHADFVSIPEKGMLYVVLCNRSFPRSKFREKIFSILGVSLQKHITPK